MPADDINYNFTENGVVYAFYDVFVPAELFRQPALWGWGWDGDGQLGNNSAGGVNNVPITTFSGGTNWKSVSSGQRHTGAIKTDGTLWLWGRSESGRLGNNIGGVGTTALTPVTTFAGGTNWKSVSCGANNHTLAIKTDGTLWVWGSNTNGKLGTNDVTDRSTPVTTFAGGTNWQSVAAGYKYSTAIKTDGTLWVWGSNDNGQLGTNGNTTTDKSTPITTFAGGNNWKSISTEYTNMVAIKTDGTLWTWGSNGQGELGINSTVSRSTPVTTFAGGTDWKYVAGGNTHAAAIKTDGTLWIWGDNTTYGQLGTNDTTDRLTPVTTFSGGTNWKQVSAGNGHTAAIKTDGTLWNWGRNSEGQLGIGSLIGRSTPVTIFLGGNNWKTVARGDYHSLAIQYVPDP